MLIAIGMVMVKPPSDPGNKAAQTLLPIYPGFINCPGIITGYNVTGKLILQFMLIVGWWPLGGEGFAVDFSDL